MEAGVVYHAGNHVGGPGSSAGNSGLRSESMQYRFSSLAFVSSDFLLFTMFISKVHPDRSCRFIVSYAGRCNRLLDEGAFMLKLFYPMMKFLEGLGRNDF